MDNSTAFFSVFGGGLGDRHQQIVDGVTTNYTLDLAAGLTQVLSDDANIYLYGNGRIAQSQITNPQSPEYFLGDALGSVRQLADPAGVVTLTQSYAPYGDVVGSVGTSQTSYAFTGEARDENGLTFLRARYLDSDTGRFVSRDTWAGDYNRPLSLNRWNYVEGNPVNFVDPSGHYGEETHYAVTIALVNKNPRAAMFQDPKNPSRTLAQTIAEGNSYMDLGRNNAVLCIPCHFNTLSASIIHVDRAIASKNVFLFGATLHQLQDYYSHWREGFTSTKFRDLGHLPDTLRRIYRSPDQVKDFYLGGHYSQVNSVPPTWIYSPYPAHDYEETINDILKRNPQLTRNALVNDDLVIDMYLRRDPYTFGSMETENQRIEARGYFGFDTDLYIANSSREIAMERISLFYINKFIDSLSDSCDMGWDAPSDHLIKLLMTSN